MRETWVRSLGREDPRRRKWQSTSVLLPGKSHEQRSLVGYSLWGRKESDMTEQLHFHFLLFFILVGLFLLSSWVYRYMCTVHYFNYYLPDFVIAICLRLSLAFRFGVFILIPFNAITDHLWNLCSWPEIKPWASGVGTLTPRTQTIRELLTLGSIK